MFILFIFIIKYIHKNVYILRNIFIWKTMTVPNVLNPNGVGFFFVAEK